MTITALATPNPRRPYYDGEVRSLPAGPVNVAVQCVKPGASYRVSIRYASTNAEVGELSKSHPTEQGARDHATTATVMFRTGITVAEALEMQGTGA